MKDGGIIIIHYKENDEPTYTDPTRYINYENLIEYFPGNVIHYAKSNLDAHNLDCLIISISKKWKRKLHFE